MSITKSNVIAIWVSIAIGLLAWAMSFFGVLVASCAFADDGSGLIAGGGSESAQVAAEVNVTYIAYDNVRYASKFGGYSLPSPDNPLHYDQVGMSSVPPSQSDIKAYYRSFDGYELLHADYYDGSLRYIYYWRYGTSRQEAERKYQEEIEGRVPEETLRELDELYDSKNWDAINNKGETGATTKGASQEEMLLGSLTEIEELLKQAQAAGNKDEVEWLKEQQARTESELTAEKAALAGAGLVEDAVHGVFSREGAEKNAELDWADDDNGPALVAVAALLTAALVAGFVIAAKRRREKTCG